MIFKRPIRIEKLDESTEKWQEYLPLAHANINKTKAGQEYLSAGAVQSQRQLTFEMRWNPDVQKIGQNTQLYRIVYEDVTYDVVDYDDFMEQHKTVKMVGVSYGS